MLSWSLSEEPRQTSVEAQGEVLEGQGKLGKKGGEQGSMEVLDRLKSSLGRDILLLSESKEDEDRLRGVLEGVRLERVGNLEGFVECLEEWGLVPFTLVVSGSVEGFDKGYVSAFEQVFSTFDLKIIEVGGRRLFNDSLLFTSWGKLESELGLPGERVMDEVILENLENRFGNKSNLLDEDLTKKKEENEKELLKYRQEFEDNKKIMQEVKEELGEYKKLYARKAGEVEVLEEEISKLREEVKNLEGGLKKSRLSGSRVSDLEFEVSEYKKMLTIKEKEYELLEDEVKELRLNYADVEIEYEATKELLADRSLEYRELSDKYEGIVEEYQNINQEVEILMSSLPDANVIENLELGIEDRDKEIEILNEDVRKLRIENVKERESKELAYRELEGLRDSYKGLLSKGEVKHDDIDTVMLSDINSQIFYFKVINQPLYFKSFIGGLESILSEKGKVLTIVLRDEDELSKIYFKDFKQVVELGEVEEGDKRVWLRPSKLMFIDEEDFFDSYDNVIVIDYTPSLKKYLIGEYVVTINVLINEREKEMLGLRGMILSAGEDSIVDMRYDKNYELAKTSFIRKRYIIAKIKKWLESAGLK